ncbi:MAG: phosphoribosylformylglycinamidine cyclo-ligase [Methanolinea sp.]|jgi:phosphoribosylformylglycinamidine cyclo-ligase|nr:phosphoribosylformylglycinamidine cyclo-ligase [Methanolinea sp.]
MSNPHTYREAGVDIRLEANAISALVQNLSYRRKGNYPMMGGVGHFAGLIDFGHLVLALTVDGVGTKMLVADRLQDWSTVGIDCMAMNVNDLYVMNMEPVAFVDYIATDRLSEEQMAQIGVGLNEGARLANVNIVGGETATLKGLVNGLDLAGTCVGVQEKGKVITGERIRPGDLVVGIPSSGIHSNGLSLARRVVEGQDAWEETLPSGRSIGRELLVPTRIYHEVLTLTAETEVHGMCHVTGGGLLNFSRLTRYGFEFTDPMPPHEIFTWIQDHGEVENAEMFRTFNMGMGYAFVVPEGAEGPILAKVSGSRVVGSVTARPGIWLNGAEIR